ncbi:PTS sugar transporter subunit IIB [Proteinivorax tanatarense]|uniref:PTS sugar transporter subunit IIB n=1 Tax=Proteinivorax tanatarense TaxID=1260629 RepID=A0AAU7VN20_9FIRM
MGKIKIMLVCAAGMSTSLLVTKMNGAAVKEKLSVDILAVSESEADEHLDSIDILLLGPQVRYLKSNMEEKLHGKDVPVSVIDSIMYGRMDGEGVLKQALELVNK